MISSQKQRFCSDAGTDCRFAACNHGMQGGMAAISPLRLAYCTQQTGGLTRGMTLRAIPASWPISSRLGLAGSGVCCNAHLDPQHCVQAATVRFRAAGPSDPHRTVGRWIWQPATVSGERCACACVDMGCVIPDLSGHRAAIPEHAAPLRRRERRLKPRDGILGAAVGRVDYGIANWQFSCCTAPSQNVWLWKQVGEADQNLSVQRRRSPAPIMSQPEVKPPTAALGKAPRLCGNIHQNPALLRSPAEGCPIRTVLGCSHLDR